VNFNQSTLAAAASTTATVAIVTLPAGSYVVGSTLTLKTQFTSSGAMTALAFSLGDSTSQTVFSRSTTLNVFQAATPATFLTDGGWFATTTAADAIGLYATATGANLNTLTAGQVEIEIAYAPLPTSTTVIP
jgi:hypothetical protein